MKPKSIEQREKYNKKICPHCGGDNDRFPGWYCSTCLKVHNEWSKEYLKIRKEEGICSRCGGKTHKTALCDKCSELHATKLREVRKRKREQNLCQDCSKPLNNPDIVRCEDCKAKRNNRRKINEAIQGGINQ